MRPVASRKPAKQHAGHRDGKRMQRFGAAQTNPNRRDEQNQTKRIGYPPRLPPQAEPDPDAKPQKNRNPGKEDSARRDQRLDRAHQERGDPAHLVSRPMIA